MKQLFTSLLAVLWLSVANHCVVAGAFAVPATPAHDCCPGRKTAPQGPHNDCPQKVCCESFTPMFSGLHAAAAAQPLVALPHLLVMVTAPTGLEAPLAKNAAIPPANGPPGPHFALIASLSLAQNAPPSPRG